MIEISEETANEALRLGYQFLGERDDILEALYQVHMHYRDRFLRERGLMDTVPGQNDEAWVGAVRDAASMRDYVESIWINDLWVAQALHATEAEALGGPVPLPEQEEA